MPQGNVPSSIMLNLEPASVEDLTRNLEDRSIKFVKINEIFRFIDKKFRHVLPWMYMFLTYKSDCKRVLFQSLRSIPIMRISNLSNNSYSLFLSANWHGDNVDDFFKQNKKQEKKKETVKESWDKVKSKNKKYLKNINKNDEYTFSDGKGPEKYISQLRMAINDISNIYVYNSGFEIQSSSPIDMVCIKRKDLLAFASSSNQSEDLGYGNYSLTGLADDSYVLEEKIVSGILARDNFTLPSEIVHVKSLRAYWDKEDQEQKNKETDAWLFGNTDTEINVVPEVNQNIIF